MPLLVGLLLFSLWALYDVVTAEATQVRNLPKLLWAAVVVLLLGIGPFAWLLFGRPASTAGGPATHPHAPRRPRRAPVIEPEVGRDSAQRVVTDRRSAELDRMLEEWERTRRDEGASDS